MSENDRKHLPGKPNANPQPEPKRKSYPEPSPRQDSEVNFQAPNEGHLPPPPPRKDGDKK